MIYCLYKKKLVVGHIEMSENFSTPIQTTVGSGKILASWIDGTATWVSDYYPHRDSEIEQSLRQRRITDLSNRFSRFRLLTPTTEFIDNTLGLLEPDESSETSQILRVTTFFTPYVDPNTLQPIMELRMPPPTYEQASMQLVQKSLSDGGRAILDTFFSAMVQHKK